MPMMTNEGVSPFYSMVRLAVRLAFGALGVVVLCLVLRSIF